MEKIGKYKVIDVLGKGAMGIVYKALDPDINREVAIKTVHFDTATEGTQKEDVQARFMREAQAAGRLTHPNIVMIYDVGREGDMTYIVMQCIEGRSLAKMIGTGEKIPPDYIIRLMTQVCQALDYAHQKGIVHRDIKPANILIDHGGTPFLADFGVARIDTSTVTQTGTVMGTPSYMSPEQVMGKRIDKRSDIFSLGVILFELLSGKRPFDGESITTVMYRIVHESPRSLRDLLKDVPSGFDFIISKALAKDPEQRYQSCLEMSYDLSNVATLPTSTMTIEGGPFIQEAERKKEEPKRKTGLIAAAAVVILVAAAAAVYFLFLGGGGSRTGTSGGTEGTKQTRQSALQAVGAKDTKTPPGKDARGQAQAASASAVDAKIVEKVQKIKESFDKQLFAETVKLSDELLKESPNNTAALDYLAKARAKIRGAAAAPLVAEGIASFNRGDFAKSQQLMQDALRQDPANKDAQNYLGLVDMEFSKREIVQIIQRQSKAEMEKDLLSLLADIGPAAVAAQRREDTVLLFNNYDNINSRTSGISVKFRDRDHADVTFAHMLTGAYKKTGEKKMLFEGSRTWSFQRQGKTWKIVNFNVE
jgi:predicted Ser/Thr protein kinase/tetratricopeptide (TPR) repeat protein